jgi:Flp pilus assembly protein protease CpaA
LGCVRHHGDSSFFDLRWREIPDALSVVLLALGLIATGFHLHRIPWLDLCLGLLLGFGAGLLLFRLGALGGGDFKLISSLGAVLGLQAELGVLFYTALIGAGLALVALPTAARISLRSRHSSRIAHFHPQGVLGMSQRRGAALVEFALMSLVLYLLIAAGVEFGRMIFISQVLQDAARVAARELAVTPLPADSTFEDALNPALHPEVAQIWNPRQLVIDVDCFTGGGPDDLDNYMNALPVVNRALRPAFISENITINGALRRLLRYPGALLLDSLTGDRNCADPVNKSGLTVGIPKVTGRDPDTGVEIIQWIQVLTEVRDEAADPATRPFSYTSTGPAKGIAAVVINYPFQSAALSDFSKNPNPADEGKNVGLVHDANDAGVTLCPGCSPSATAPLNVTDVATQIEGGFGTYAGPYGLGR